MTLSIDEQLWRAAGVKSCIELPGFPYTSFAEFVSAAQTGDVSLGIEYSAAKKLVRITKSPGGEYFLIGLCWIPFLLIIASIGVGIMTGRWLALLGMLAPPIALLAANPYNPIQRSVFVASLGLLGYCVFKGTILMPMTWMAFCFAASAIITRSLNRIAWKWAKKAVLRSESLAAYLFKTGNLHLKNDSFGTWSMATAATMFPHLCPSDRSSDASKILDTNEDAGN